MERKFLLFYGFIAIVTALMLSNIEKTDMIHDEVYYATGTLGLLLGQPERLFGFEFAHFLHGPTGHFLLALSQVFFNSMRFIGVFLFSLCVLVFHGILKQFNQNRLTPLFAFSFAPFLLWYSPRTMLDIHTFTLFLIGFYLMVRKEFFLSNISLTLSAFSRYPYIPLIVPIIIYNILKDRKSLIPLLFTFLPFLIYNLQVPDFMSEVKYATGILVQYPQSLNILFEIAVLFSPLFFLILFRLKNIRWDQIKIVMLVSAVLYMLTFLVSGKLLFSRYFLPIIPYLILIADLPEFLPSILFGSISSLLFIITNTFTSPLWLVPSDKLKVLMILSLLIPLPFTYSNLPGLAASSFISLSLPLTLPRAFDQYHGHIILTDYIRENIKSPIISIHPGHEIIYDYYLNQKRTLSISQTRRGFVVVDHYLSKTENFDPTGCTELFNARLGPIWAGTIYNCL